jgi:hypothetical protein
MNKPVPNLEQYLAAMQAMRFGSVPLASTASENVEMLKELEAFDPIKTASTFAGLLTVPELQSNCLRLEAIVHLSLAYCRGERKPTAKFASRLFAEFGKGMCGRAEDPAEDVFVTSIATRRGNSRVLEGIWECAGFFLQRVVNVVERMPQGGGYDHMRDAVYSLLAISDLVCERANLTRFQLGNEARLKSLPRQLAEAGSALRRRVKFSPDELRARGISIDGLAEFGFSPEIRGRLARESITHTTLERFPVGRRNGELFLLLPTAVSAAVRRYVIEQVSAIGMREAFLAALADDYARLFAEMPLLGGRSGAEIEFRRTDNGALASLLKRVDNGRYMNLVFFLDTLEKFETDGFAGPNPDPEKLAVDIDAWIDSAYEDARKESDFRQGFTLIVSCGVGRPVVSIRRRNDRKNWPIEFVSAGDLAVLSWLQDFTPLSLFRLLDGREHLKAAGVSLKNVNGLLNMIAWSRLHGGHLVPHGDLPEEFTTSDRPKLVLIEQNGLRRLRHEVTVEGDPHAAMDVHGRWRKVRRDGRSIFEEDRGTPIFICEKGEEGEWPLGIYETAKRAWWGQLETPEKTPGYWIHERWLMVRCWLSRSPPVLENALSGLPDGPLLLRAKFEGQIGEREGQGDIELLDYESAKAEIELRVDPEQRSVSLIFHPRFENAIFHPENIAERAFVARIVEGFALLGGETLSSADRERLVAKIVPDAFARQTHSFRAQNFRDFVNGSVPQTPLKIDDDDAATLRLGLGWRIRDKALGGDIRGKQECTVFLNNVVAMLEDDVCSDCRQFDRAALIAFALRNHESAMNDHERWVRTAAAVLSLHEDKDATRRTIAERDFELSAIFQSSRLLVEFAICESPVSGGGKPGKLDYSRLMAKVNLLAGLGNWSDAIHWDAMEPQLRVTPLGDVHASLQFHDNVLMPFAQAGSDSRVNEAVRDYASIFDDPTIESAAGVSLEPRFSEAWEAEFGASFDETRRFIDLIEDLGIRAQQAILRLPMSSIVQTVTGVKGLAPATAAGLIESLTFKSRLRWRNVPEGYSEKDRHPWRFRRRLSMLRKPLLRLDDLDDATMMVAPGILRGAVAYMAHNFYHGNFPGRQLTPAMSRWFGIARGKRQAFNSRVAGRLKELGWSAEPDVTVSHLLKLEGLKGFGDVDVLAWSRERGRVLVIECKDLQYQKTDGEVAEQLADFRGELRSNGKPDDLLKHLNRVDVISRNVSALMKFIGVDQPPKIENYLVFRNPVPMQFAWERMKKRVRLHTFAELDSI